MQTVRDGCILSHFPSSSVLNFSRIWPLLSDFSRAAGVVVEVSLVMKMNHDCLEVSFVHITCGLVMAFIRQTR